MKREKLEQRISEAIDGYLSSGELRNLESELQSYPDLWEEYQSLRSQELFGDLETAIPEVRPSVEQLSMLRSHLENPFYSTVVVMFKRYFLAASLLLAVFATGMHLLIDQQPAVAEDALFEWIYENNTESIADESEIWFFSELEEE